jgi:hypothetical protein
MTTISTFEIKNLDLNTLFNFSFNFDNLKQTLEYLITNQKLQNEKIQMMEERMGITTKSSEFIEKGLEENNQPEKKEDEKTSSKEFIKRKETLRMKNSGLEFKENSDTTVRI